jgi:HEAT repeat protein
LRLIPPLARAAAAAVVLTALLIAVPPPEAAASTADLAFHDCSFAKDGVGNGECQHFLRNPAGATDDPCWCDKCRNGPSGQRHDGHTIPPKWNPELFERGGMDVYLKRHSVAWGITCSECYYNDKPWPDGDGKLLGTVPPKDWAGRPAKDTVQQRFNKESRFYKNPADVIVAYNRHFYVMSDVDGLKVKMPSGSSRAITPHEWVHLMIERAEFARREWERNFGPTMPEQQKPGLKDAIPVVPMLLVYCNRQRDYERISSEYFKGAASKGLKGAGAVLCNGMCLTGIGMSKEKFTDDHELTVVTRHQMGHNLFSMWQSWQTRPRSLPAWIDEGIAHWLTKSVEQFKDDAQYCTGEAQAANGAGAPQFSRKDWDKDVAKWAASPGKLRPIEEMMAVADVAKLGEEDQKRSWSYVDLCLTEWREPFVKLVAALRQEKDVREAFTSALGCTPDAFDQRWRDRVTGKRKSMAPSAADDDPDADATTGSKDRKAIRGETNPQSLAAKLRALGEVKDKKTIPVVVDVIAQNSDLSRETALVTLLRVKDPACLEVLWNYGLGHSDGIVRAYTAKVCGRLKLTAALTKLEEQLEDKNWYARAEAAVACGMMKDAKAMAGMRKIVASDPSDKAQVGAMDALAMFGEEAAIAAPGIAKELDSSQWQIRIAAAQALGELGQMESVEALISRMEKETGRVPDDIYAALKKITRDDLGRKPENWRKMWDHAKADSPGGLPKRPDAKPDAPKAPPPEEKGATHDAAPAPYFGVEIYSNRVAFVIDTTETMLTLFTPDPAASKALSREYVGSDKLTICKQEIMQALSQLDPRSHFNIISFGMQIKPFRQNPVPASAGNITEAGDFLRSLVGAGRTNYYGALKAALDIGSEPDTNPGFKATPDTITFLTDGVPNEGDIVDGDTLLEWYTGLNRYARVKTHTITFGLVNVDMPLLRGLAERNGGRFTIVPELKKPKGR